MILWLCSNHRMNVPEQRKESWGCLQWGVVVLVLVLAVIYLLPYRHMISHISDQTKAANNCRQIIVALKIWASDNNGVFPDTGTPPPTSSNQVFRKLIRDGIVKDERIFGGTNSPFLPDSELGNAPDYPRSLEPGENHWAMLAGLKIDNDGTHPQIFENTSNSQRPPRWLVNQTQPVRGRTWKSGRIIVGRLDNSVNSEQLVERNGALTLPGSVLNPNGNEAILPIRILDIEEKK